jgi:beta-galactosidase GanA
MKEWGLVAEADKPVRDVPDGGVLVARLSANEYLVTGRNARVSFGRSSSAEKAEGFLYARVEEGHYDDKGQWVFERVWNGDQTDYGLNFTTLPQMLRVRLATY